MGRHSDQPAPTESARPSFVRRHRGLLGSVLVLVVALVGAAAVFAFMLNSSLGNIERVPVTLEESNRPPVVQTESLNILLLGADAGSKRDPGGNSILEDAASGTWPKGKYRSDATMLVHIDADRKSAYIASIPRDSYVPLYDAKGAKKQSSKINAALSLYGPSGAISTVENLTDLRIDHLAMVDWDGFEDITNSLGGVDIITERGRRAPAQRQASAGLRRRAQYSLGRRLRPRQAAAELDAFDDGGDAGQGHLDQPAQAAQHRLVDLQEHGGRRRLVQWLDPIVGRSPCAGSARPTSPS